VGRGLVLSAQSPYSPSSSSSGRDLDDELVVFGALEAAKKGGKPSQIPLRYWIPDRTWDACGGALDLARLK